MQSNNFDDLFKPAGEIVRQLRTTFKDVTGEEFDLEEALKNYPLVLLGAAAGIGILAGVWIGRRNARALPPPPPAPPDHRPSNPLQALENLFPGKLDRVREVVPEALVEEAADAAKHWLDTVLEPRLKHGMNNVSSNVTESRFGSFLRQTVKRFEASPDQHLDDPEIPPQPDTPRE